MLEKGRLFLVVTCAEALFFGGNFSGKAPKLHFADTHDQAWHTAKIALFSTVLWVPVGAGMIFVSPPSSFAGLSHTIHDQTSIKLRGNSFFLLMGLALPFMSCSDFCLNMLEQLGVATSFPVFLLDLCGTYVGGTAERQHFALP